MLRGDPSDPGAYVVPNVTIVLAGIAPTAPTTTRPASIRVPPLQLLFPFDNISVLAPSTSSDNSNAPPIAPASVPPLLLPSRAFPVNVIGLEIVLRTQTAPYDARFDPGSPPPESEIGWLAGIATLLSKICPPPNGPPVITIGLFALAPVFPKFPAL